MFHSVPGVPCVKVERFACVNTQTCASPHQAIGIKPADYQSDIDNDAKAGLKRIGQ